MEKSFAKARDSRPSNRPTATAKIGGVTVKLARPAAGPKHNSAKAIREAVAAYRAKAKA